MDNKKKGLRVPKAKIPKKNANSKKNKVVKSSTFPIVAIGASAGGLEAFAQFFKDLELCGMAYVVITHLDRDHKSVLPELISTYTSAPVVKIKSGTIVKPDHIYVIPPKTNITIKDGVLLFSKQHEPHFKNQPISLFFHSLAEDRGKNAIAVILSGSGSDGSSALPEFKEHEGLIIAQNPASAAYDSMPRAAINTGLVDFVMNPEDISHQLKKLIIHGDKDCKNIPPELLQILTLLRTHTGHDFSHYKLSTVCRRIEKQMLEHHITTLAEYYKFLQFDKSEIDNLLKDMLIGVTRFFRDNDAFECLKNEMSARIFKNLPDDYCIRVWVPACSTGEEAYSIAILLHECMHEIGKTYNLQILATDIDLHALSVARSAIYPAAIEADVSPERLGRYFIKEGDHYKIKSDIRSNVIFGEQNIIKDPPFTRIDLVTCRNLLIYLDAKLQKKVLPLLHYSLRPGGILFLGMSEAASGFTDYFELISKHYKVFRRKDTISSPRPLLGFDIMSRSVETPYLGDIVSYETDELDIKQAIQTFILDHYTSPCAVVNKNGDVIYTHGNMDNFLIGFGKKANLNIFKDTYLDIKMVLLPAIHRVRVSKRKIINNNTKVEVGKKKLFLNFHVLPITHINALRDHILVIFENANKDAHCKLLENSPGQKKNNIRLEMAIQELQNTKENLQATIEELEAGNEELQSTNEELQSTNEEIETSKEEMQSLNEELVSVNTELQMKIDQLANINDDMSNLFNSTEIAAFFLDNHLNIKRFTPKAQEFMHLIQSDIGRPFDHFKTTIKNDNIATNAEDVLKTLVQKNYEVETTDNRWYNIRILPYRTLTNNIDGVVITLSDITTIKETQNKLHELNKALKNTMSYTKNIINMIGMPILVLSSDLLIVTANDDFYDTFKIRNTNINDHYLYEIKHGLFDNQELLSALLKSLSGEGPMPAMEIKIDSDVIKETRCSIRAQTFPLPETNENQIFLRLELLA